MSGEVKTRVIIDADAGNAIKEIGKLDTVAGEADQALNKLDDTKITIDVDADKLDTVKHKADDVAGSSRTASTAIGGIGNSISELPGIGSMGPVVESFGQLTENALEGEAAIGGLIGAAGGLALVSVALKGIQGRQERIAKSKAFEKEEIEAYADALRETDSVLKAVEKKLRDTQKLTVDIGEGLLNLDLTEQVQNSGVTVEQFSQLVVGGKEAIAEFTAAMTESGVPVEQWGAVTLAAANESLKLAEAQEVAAAATKFFGKETDTAAAAVERVTTATGAYADYLDDAALKTKGLEDAVARLRDELSDESGFLAVQDGFDGLAAAALTALDASKRHTEDAEGAARDYAQQLNSSKSQVLDYMDQIGQIPVDKQTEIIALIDQGKYDEVERQLALLELAREVPFSAILVKNKTSIGAGDGLGSTVPRSAGATNNIVVNLPRAAAARDVTAALTRWSRVNG